MVKESFRKGNHKLPDPFYTNGFIKNTKNYRILLSWKKEATIKIKCHQQWQSLTEKTPNYTI